MKMFQLAQVSNNWQVEIVGRTLLEIDHLGTLLPVWLDWVIYWWLGDFLKACGNELLAQSAHIFGQFLKTCRIC